MASAFNVKVVTREITVHVVFLELYQLQTLLQPVLQLPGEHEEAANSFQNCHGLDVFLELLLMRLLLQL